MSTTSSTAVLSTASMSIKEEALRKVKEANENADKIQQQLRDAEMQRRQRMYLQSQEAYRKKRAEEVRQQKTERAEWGTVVIREAQTRKLDEIKVAADAALTMSTSGSWSWSVARRRPMTWTSFMKPFGKSGRSGRSQRREVRISFSEGLPSRLK